MMAAPPLVLMMAGGTGGHVYPALAVAGELASRGYRVEWVGTHRGLEHRVVPAAGIVLHYLPVRGVRGKGVLDKLLAVFFLAIAALGALLLVLRRAPACVVGMGGYVAGPAGVAAWLLRRPLLIHEQNAVAGTTNRMLAPLAQKIVTGFDNAFNSARPCEVVGNPVREELVRAGAAATYDYDGRRPLRLLVLGGSLGARPINAVLPGTLRDSRLAHIEVWHQSGETLLQEVRGAYGETLSRIRLAPFIDDMQAAYAWADLVLCRAGALTVAELAVMQRPAILVPLPQAIDDHQSANARALTAAGAARLLPQADMSEESLAQLLADFIANPGQLRRMAEAAGRVATPLATQRVADRCEELMHAG